MDLSMQKESCILASSGGVGGTSMVSSSVKQ